MKKFCQIFLAFVLSLAVIGGVVYGTFAIITNEANPVLWPEYFQKADEDNDEEKNGTGNADNAILSDFEESGMNVTSVLLPAKAYAANGVAESADTAYLLTYTVTPADVLDKSVTVIVSFANPSSTWAKGKDVADYVTAEYQGNTSVVVTCLAPFGEQVILTLTANSNEKVKANCTVDYLRVPLSVSAKAGTNANLFGSTTIGIIAYSNNSTLGGLVSLSVTYSDIYTLEGDYIEKLSLYHELEEIGKPPIIYCAFTGTVSGAVRTFDYDDAENILGEEIYFDQRALERFNFRYTVDSNQSYLKDLTMDKIKEVNSLISGGIMWKVTATLSYGERVYSWENNLKVGFNANRPADSVNPDVPGVVF